MQIEVNDFGGKRQPIS